MCVGSIGSRLCETGGGRGSAGGEINGTLVSCILHLPLSPSISSAANPMSSKLLLYASKYISSPSTRDCIHNEEAHPVTMLSTERASSGSFLTATPRRNSFLYRCIVSVTSWNSPTSFARLSGRASASSSVRSVSAVERREALGRRNRRKRDVKPMLGCDFVAWKVAEDGGVVEDEGRGAVYCAPERPKTQRWLSRAPLHWMATGKRVRGKGGRENSIK